MKKLVILGAGCGGTMMANKMRKHLGDDWSVTIIDRNNIHDYQPGYLFVPFDINKPKDIRRTKKEFMNPGIDFVISEIVNVDWNKQAALAAKETQIQTQANEYKNMIFKKAQQFSSEQKKKENQEFEALKKNYDSLLDAHRQL